MKRIKYSPGGQPFFNFDYSFEQDEIWKAINADLLDAGGCIISGCEVSGSSISAGYVHLDGKILPLDAATGLSFPCYIRKAATVDYDIRQFTEDLQNKATRTEERAEIVTTAPSIGQFITVTAGGVDKKARVVLQNQQTGQFNVTGFDLNAGRVSYVELSRTTNQSLAAGFNFVAWTGEIDDRSEFTIANGEFVASQSGIYNICFSGRVDVATTNGVEFAIQFWTGSSWVKVAGALRNNATIQGELSTSANRKLATGQKIRIVVLGVGTSIPPLQYANASIVRVA